MLLKLNCGKNALLWKNCSKQLSASQYRNAAHVAAFLVIRGNLTGSNLSYSVQKQEKNPKIIIARALPSVTGFFMNEPIFTSMLRMLVKI